MHRHRAKRTNCVCIGDEKHEGEDTEKNDDQETGAERGKDQSQQKEEGLGVMSMRDCENSRADLGEPDVRELVMQSLKGQHREEAEQDTGVRWGGDGSLQKMEEIGIYRNA